MVSGKSWEGQGDKQMALLCDDDLKDGKRKGRMAEEGG